MPDAQTDMPDAQQEFKIEEFRQLHEHIRTFETALANIFTVSLTVCTTLLAGLFAWFVQVYHGELDKMDIAFCYLFLGPASLSIAALALISSYRTSIYRNGYYVMVFLEDARAGPRWHLDLAKYRKRVPDEHGNPAVFMLWALLATSTVWFSLGLVLKHPQPSRWHYAAPLALVIVMFWQHLAFRSARRTIEIAWHKVQDPNWVAPPPEPRFWWKSVWTALTGRPDLK
jgi:hypothetical protein